MLRLQGYRVRIAILAILAVLILARCIGRSPELSIQEYTVLDHKLSITLYGKRNDAVFYHVNRILTNPEEGTGIAGMGEQIDRLCEMAGTERVSFNDDLFMLIEKSVNFARISNGMYDPTAAPLYRLWALYQSSADQPSRDDVYRLLETVDYSGIRIFPETKEVFLEQTGMRMDMEEITDGYIIDWCAEMMAEYDFIGLILECGNVTRYVLRRGAEEIDCSTRHEITDRKQLPVLSLKNCENRAVAVIYPQGRLILDPRNGYPVRNTLWCVVTIGPDALSVDALAFIIAASGARQGIGLINDMPFFDALCVTRNREVFVSKRGRTYLGSHAAGYSVIDME